ncbi:uncharacterized protein LOC110623648 [Manihot esculenta]|uniref:SHSP domain-containing protein n=1 Tax=Manihot esculenta TaxID=3983 RepID=A0A2C9VAP3_MANES|nr:uncharacterized protein LOC110623648 [Manihot esculenta]OAY41907.1 hypothetical protein MANES_09G138800v8 [Manihot esculenta]
MAGATVFEDFEPYCKWQKDQERDVLEVHLNGFKKDQLKIQLSNLGVMTITGERPLEGSKRSRFRKELRLSKDYVTDEIRAKMSGGILSIIMPKKTELTPPSFRDNKPTLPPQNQENERTTPPRTATQNTKTSMFSSYRFQLPDNIILNLGTRNVATAFALLIVVGAFVMYKYRQLSPPVES